jgi:hypothetical protein
MSSEMGPLAALGEEQIDIRSTVNGPQLFAD